MAAALLDKAGISFRKVYAEDEPATATAYGVVQAPTLVILGDNEITRVQNVSNIKKYIDSVK